MRSIGLSIGRQDTPKSMLRPTGNACAKADKYEPIRDEYLSYWGQDEFSSGLEFNLGSTPIFPSSSSSATSDYLCEQTAFVSIKSGLLLIVAAQRWTA